MSKYELEQMNTEDLEYILQMDALRQDEGSDEEKIWLVMEILAERRRKNPEVDFLGVEQSWESFRKKYNPSGSTAVDLKSKVHRQSWLKPLVGVAAMFVFCCGILSMHASSYNVWKEIARWTVCQSISI